MAWFRMSACLYKTWETLCSRMQDRRMLGGGGKQEEKQSGQQLLVGNGRKWRWTARPDNGCGTAAGNGLAQTSLFLGFL